MLEILELFLVEARDKSSEPQTLLGITCALELRLVDADQIGPPSRRDVDRCEALGGLRTDIRIVQVALERGDRGRLLRIAAEGRRVVLDRRLEIVEAFVVQIAERLLGRTAPQVGLAEFLEGASPRTTDATFAGASGRWEVRRGGFPNAAGSLW